MSAPLFDAIGRHDLEEVHRLLLEGAEASQHEHGPRGWTPLHAAIDELEQGGPLESLVLLLRAGARVDARDARGESSPLLMAIFRGQRLATLLLLAMGADVNVVGGEGDSPLRWAAETRDHELAAILLRCGASRTIDTFGGPAGMTALGIAASNVDDRMAELLVSAGADIAALDLDRRRAAELLPPRTEESAANWARLSERLAKGELADSMGGR